MIIYTTTTWCNKRPLSGTPLPPPRHRFAPTSAIQPVTHWAILVEIHSYATSKDIRYVCTSSSVCSRPCKDDGFFRWYHGTGSC